MAISDTTRVIHHSLLRLEQSVKTSGTVTDWFRNHITKHPIDPSTLYFGQQHVTTYELFDEPRHTVPLESLPHFRFLEGDTEPYRRYLAESWKYYERVNTRTARSAQITYFEHLRDDIRRNGIGTPIKYVTRPDGTRLIFDGTHRSAIAQHLGIDLPAVEISLEAFILENLGLAEGFYGIGHEGIPYASIYHDREEVITGRRRDLLDRHDHVWTEDIRDRYVIDLGCNTGSASLLAAECADFVLGVDYDPDLVTAAIRLNTLFTTPCEFRRMDLSRGQSFDRAYDTAFCFSVDKHVDNDDVLSENIRRTGADVLYFETHQRAPVPSAIEELAIDREFRGTTGTHGPRKLYRFELP